MKGLAIAKGLSLPVDAVTQTIAILAKRRVGKSYAARRFAEQFFNAGQQIVIVDPKGDWWGIRSSADGKSPGLPVVILGGERGDVPLEVDSGKVVANLAGEERVSMLLDLSLFSKRQLAIFMTDFLEHLYRIKAREVFRTPLMLLIDEADAIAPQKPQDNEARMLGAAEDIVRRGGQRGLGCILVTQRSAVLNKNVVTQSEMIVALRTISPQDLKAMDEWIDVHGTREQRATLMSSLPSLPVGDAWFWSPGWPTEDGIFQRVHVLPIETFDSGASPRPGEKRVEPKNLADVDLGALTKQMAATIEKAKADDPKLLKAEIVRLKKEIDTAGKKNGHGAVKEKLVIQPVVDHAAIERAVKKATEAFDRDQRQFRQGLKREIDRLQRQFEPIGTTIAALSSAVAAEFKRSAPSPIVTIDRDSLTRIVKPVPVPRAAKPDIQPTGYEPISNPQLKILNAVWQLNQLGVATPTLVQVALFVGVSHTTGTYKQNVRDLEETGCVQRFPGAIALTPAGVKLVDQTAVPPDPIEFWKGKLPGSQAKLLEKIIDRYPEPITREELAVSVGVSHTTGTFKQNLRDMATYGIIDLAAGQAVASELLFP